MGIQIKRIEKRSISDIMNENKKSLKEFSEMTHAYILTGGGAGDKFNRLVEYKNKNYTPLMFSESEQSKLESKYGSLNTFHIAQKVMYNTPTGEHHHEIDAIANAFANLMVKNDLYEELKLNGYIDEDGCLVKSKVQNNYQESLNLMFEISNKYLGELNSRIEGKIDEKKEYVSFQNGLNSFIKELESKGFKSKLYRFNEDSTITFCESDNNNEKVIIIKVVLMGNKKEYKELNIVIKDKGKINAYTINKDGLNKSSLSRLPNNSLDILNKK